MKGRAPEQLDPSQLEEFLPKLGGEDHVPVTHNGAQEPMEAHNFIEEGASNRLHRVGVAKGAKMRHLGEPVDDGDDDRLFANTWKPLDKVHGGVTTHVG